MAIEVYQPVDEGQVQMANLKAMSVLPGACSEHVSQCTIQLFPLLKQARLVCEPEDLFAKLAYLLITYQNVFSKGDCD